MIQGDPLEDSVNDASDVTDAAFVGPVMHAPDPGRPKEIADSTEPLAQTPGTDPDDLQDDGDGDGDIDMLDTDVQDLLNALADEEFLHDAAWVETSDIAGRTGEDDTDDEDAAPEPDDSTETAITVLKDDPAITISDRPAPLLVDRDSDEDPATEGSDETDAPIDEAPSVTPAEPDGIEPDSVDLDEAPDLAGASQEGPPPASPENDGSTASLLGLQAINIMGEKISASEERYDTALNKMGHALGIIAQRIDSLETRMTSQTIANVALAAAPPADLGDDDGDSGVAPYIARAERELKARKESGTMDIFDRIAKAAENEFDDHAATAETRILANSSDGRRVGTKRWQPSKTVKRRMEQLERSKAGAAAGNGNPTGGKRATTGSAPAPRADPVAALDEDVVTKAGMDSHVAPEPTFDPEEDEDSGLSVVPGARGRRRNRARKSRLDEDFENVFVEDDGQPSIQSLRRKMRDRPADDPEAVETGKGGMLGNILGKKSPPRPAPAPQGDLDDEETLRTPFDEPAPKATGSSKKSKPRASEEIDDFDDDDEDDGWNDEDTRIDSKQKPLMYFLVAVTVVAIGGFVWQTFMS